MFEIWLDRGSAGRVLVADSLTHFAAGVTSDDIVVGASFAGAPTAAVPLAAGVKGWIAHEAGPGKDQAGISGLAASQQHKIPAAAIATMSARLSDGRSLLAGRVSVANQLAQGLGVEVGQLGADAARLMLAAPPGHRVDLGPVVDEILHEVLAPLTANSGGIYAVWSFMLIQKAMSRDVVCVASHAARVMAEYALRDAKPRGVIANDAGMGLDGSGADGLPILDSHGIAAATVSSDSARIGDALSTYHDGIISAANDAAQRRGVSVGISARQAADMMLV